MDKVLIDTDVILDFFLIESLSLSLLVRYLIYVKKRRLRDILPQLLFAMFIIY